MEIKRGKGRPKKELELAPRTETTIEDPLFYGHKIVITKDQFAVYQIVEGSKDRPKGFYTTLPNALNKIAKIQINNLPKYRSLKEYLDGYKETINKLNNR